MLGILTDIVSKARSDSAIGDRLSNLRGGEPAAGDTGSEPSSTLFECPACNTVFVAIEKTDCGNCDGTVRAVDDSAQAEDGPDPQAVDPPEQQPEDLPQQ